jgi:hypothetical protein
LGENGAFTLLLLYDYFLLLYYDYEYNF